MKPFDQIGPTQLTWIQTELMKPIYELRSAEQVVARLSWVKECGTHAEVTFHNQKYSFKRSGFWKPFVTVRKDGAPHDWATIELSWLSESRLVMPDGRSYGWSLTSMWRQEWAFAANDKTPLVTFKTKNTVKGLQADVMLAQSVKHHADAPLLVALGWYLIAAYATSDGGAEIAAIMAAIS